MKLELRKTKVHLPSIDLLLWPVRFLQFLLHAVVVPFVDFDPRESESLSQLHLELVVPVTVPLKLPLEYVELVFFESFAAL